jgi:serine/threonine protein kinase
MTCGMSRFVVRSGALEGKVFDLPAGQTVEIGRGRACLVCLSEDTGISRRHSVLVPHDAVHVIQDCGSKNGTFVNGRRVDKAELHSGDVVQVGTCRMSYFNESKDPLIGNTISGYRVVDRIGSGGMGVVYRAVQVSMNRPVALKVLDRKLAENHDFVLSFVKEARFMAKVSHPHVVQVHTVGKHEGLYYLAMEYMEGGSLQALIDKEGQLPPRRVLPMILDAARALMWAGEKGIVHRDIKPANLLLDERGTVKVADFGIAMEVVPSVDRGGASLAVGTPHFMAPEQAFGRPVDRRADIYALGSTLYCALTGEVPFARESAREVLLRKIRKTAPSISRRVADLPAGLEALVQKAMAYKPEARYQNAEDLYRALGQILRALEAGSSRPASAPLSVGRASRERRRRLMRRVPQRSESLLMVPLLLIIIACGVVIWFWLSRKQNEGGPASVSTPYVQPPGFGGPPAPDPPVPPVVPKGTTQEPREPPPDPPSPPPPGADLAALDRDLEELILEGDFASASKRCVDVRDRNHALEEEVNARLRRVRAAERLIQARKRALQLEQEGKYVEAKLELNKILSELVDPYSSEAREALTVIEGRETGHETQRDGEKERAE